LLAAITQQRNELEQARLRAQTLASELQQIEQRLGEVDQQTNAIEQQRIKMQQSMTEQEAVYRRALLDSQKARDALETLLEQMREEMGIADPIELAQHSVSIDPTQESAANGNDNSNGQHTEATGSLSEEEETQLRRLRRRVDNLRSRIKAMGGCDVNAPQEYEETRTRYEFLTTQINDMDQAALQLRTIIGQLDATMAQQFETTFQAVNARFREHFTTLFNGGNARLELIAPKASDDDSPVPSSMPSGIEVVVQPPGK
jgi:chromosome segregation protein